MKKEVLEKVIDELNKLFSKESFFIHAEVESTAMQGRFSKVLGIYNTAIDSLDKEKDKDLIKFLRNEMMSSLKIADAKNLANPDKPLNANGDSVNFNFLDIRKMVEAQNHRFAFEIMKYDPESSLALQDSLRGVSIIDSTAKADTTYIPAKIKIEEVQNTVKK